MRRLTSENKARKYKMAKILISPSKYLQGAGEMKNLGTYAAKSGKKALVLISKGGYKRIGKTIEESFAESTCEVVFDLSLIHIFFYRMAFHIRHRGSGCRASRRGCGS